MSLERGDRIFDQQAFARSLRVRCAELGISGRDAADAAGVSRSTFSRCTRHWPPDVETYLRLCRWIENSALLSKDPTP